MASGFEVDLDAFILENDVAAVFVEILARVDILDVDWCSRCLLVKRLSKQESVWLFNGEVPDGKFNLILRREGFGGYTDTELLTSTLMEIGDWMAFQDWCDRRPNTSNSLETAGSIP